MDFINNDFAKEVSCIPQVTRQSPFLTGEGVIVAVLDSGIDYFLPEFVGNDGRTRLLGIWDQSAAPNPQKGLMPPTGFKEGVLYTREMIDEALSLGRADGQSKVPVLDLSGHGTGVAGVAAGTQLGIAPKADILVIKLGNPLPDTFPRTTQLMRGISYAVKLGTELNRPVVINISFGNTYGDHRGNSLLERFIDNASEIGKNVIVIGSGNEGASRGHISGMVSSMPRVELAVAGYETNLSVQLWKYYQDIYNVTVVSPSGERVILEISDIKKAQTLRRTLEQTELLCYIGEPAPYSVNQEIYIDMLPAGNGNYINEGIWRFELTPVSIVTGEYSFYLPSYAVRNVGTGFFLPTPEMTLTVPSAARRAVSVGAYDAALQSYADFSGRGYVYRYDAERGGISGYSSAIAEVKPDISAPGVDIAVPMPGGGYERVSGTSFATPIVAGSAALMMEWGIVRGNDPFLFGQKLKAYLVKGAKPIRGIAERVGSMAGWGALCLQNSLPL